MSNDGEDDLNDLYGDLERRVLHELPEDEPDDDAEIDLFLALRPPPGADHDHDHDHGADEPGQPGQERGGDATDGTAAGAETATTQAGGAGKAGAAGTPAAAGSATTAGAAAADAATTADAATADAATADAVTGDTAAADAAADMTLGGYIDLHNRVPAFEGSDGMPYTVDVDVVPAEGGAQPFAAFLMFIRWAATGAGIMDHMESGDVAWGSDEDGARQAAMELSLYEVRAELDAAIERRRSNRDEGA